MTVSEQRYAIGVWRVCGATRSLITRLFLIQAAVLGLVGGALGTAIGLTVSWYVNNKIAVLLREQGLAAMTIEPPTTTFIVSAIGLTTLLAVLAGVHPARRAARQIQV
jgi:putative ABC transport system permease protein